MYQRKCIDNEDTITVDRAPVLNTSSVQYQAQGRYSQLITWTWISWL